MILTQSFGLDQNQHRQDDFYPTQLDLDLEFDLDLSADDNSSIASSLHPLSPSTEYGAVLSEASPVTFESVSTLSIPRQVSGAPSQFPTSLSPPAAGHQPLATHLMQPDTWLVGGHYTPRSAARFSHNRESSLSSLGSTGPASPYNTNTSNPHIAVTDSTADGFADLHAHENSYYHLAKTMAPPHVGIYADYHTVAPDVSMPQHLGIGGTAVPRPRDDRGLLPAPDFPGAYGPTRSHPTSVASSIAGDSPATPSIGEPEDHRRRKAVFDSVPKLDRTMTDVYGDGLYSPEFTITSPSTLQLQPLPVSPSRDVFAQRLQAANSQHLSAAQSPSLASSRSRSPFTHGSPLAPTSGHDFGAASSAAAAKSRSRLGSTHERFKADQLVGQRRSEPETPKTISPKDAVLEFHEAEGEASPFPLFHSLQETALLYDQVAKQAMTHGNNGPYPRGQPPSSTSADSPFPYATAQIPVSIPVPQQYPFIAHPRPGNDEAALATPTDSKSDDLKAGPPRPGNVGAESGTYSCTYHGCTMRFATPALLQKHKREGHRQAHSLAGGRRPDSALVASMMTQAGPHRCDRINPSTGKPCNSIFSRPYDLTRHEDTIHNARKQKVRCSLCTEEKTFSRADALTRHFRVCHPDVEFPGKHRRRGAAQD